MEHSRTLSLGYCLHCGTTNLMILIIILCNDYELITYGRIITMIAYKLPRPVNIREIEEKDENLISMTSYISSAYM